ncbi:tyrosine-type recombinase/integrase [Sulfurovum sp.]|uniref:tyrosine-type recombinase/integrase n=1 Tax=Sulfurovum sp. TaxID=1969726 RepID=UPI00286815E1|nr:tyrosine-type recombinase/integrase [Sulfurovum sp.]
MTIDNIFQQYVELKKVKWSQHTLHSNLSSYNNHIYPIIGEKNIDTLNYIDYQKLANKLLDRGLAPKTVKNVFIIISGIVTFALKTDLYTGTNYVQYVEFPDFDNKRYFTLSATLQKKYIQAILNFNEPIYKDIFLFLLHGRRLNEVLDLKWEFLDMNEGIFYLPSARNKSRKNLSFNMTDKQMKVLRSYQDQEQDFKNVAYLKGHVFLNSYTGKRFNDIRKPWARLLTRADLPKIRIHDIRHLIGTYLINELNTPMEVVSHLLGHSDIKVTQRYVNPKPMNAKTAMDNLFNSVQTELQKSVEKLNHAINIGECIQTILFDEKTLKVRNV